MVYSLSTSFRKAEIRFCGQENEGFSFHTLMATAGCLIMHLVRNIWWNKICEVLLLFVCLGRLKGKSTISSVWKETREIILLCLAQLQVCRSLFEVLPLFPEWICLMCNDVFCIRWLMFDHLAWSFLQVQLLQNKKVQRCSFSDKHSVNFVFLVWSW